MERETYRYRIKFSKYGGMIFIGHLDLMRYFQKAIRRAGLPVSYSKGFSPHQKMSFASPLGVGKATNGDYMDIELDEPMDIGMIKNRMVNAVGEGVDIKNIVRLPDNAENAMASLFAAAYTIRFRSGHEKALDPVLSKENSRNLNYRFRYFEDFLSQDKIIYHKISKKSESDVDLKEGIFEYRIKDDEYVCITLNASSSGSIKPIHLLEAYADYVGVNRPKEIDFLITREEMYLKGSDGKLVPMDEVQDVYKERK